jgi:hypothetical protein
VGKPRGGATYCYLVESSRVGGKPRIVSQEYLGTAEELAAAMRGGGLGLPDRIQHKDFSAVAAAWGVLEELEVAAFSVRKRVCSDSSARSANCSGGSPAVSIIFSPPARPVSPQCVYGLLEEDRKERGRGGAEHGATATARVVTDSSTESAGDRGHGETWNRRFFRSVLVLLAMISPGRVIGHGDQSAARQSLLRPGWNGLSAASCHTLPVA